MDQDLPVAHVCLSADGSCSVAEPDIHCGLKLRRAVTEDVSLCSLPVPKQFAESLWSVISFAQSPTCRTLAACARKDPDVFPFLGRVFRLPRCE